MKINPKRTVQLFGHLKYEDIEKPLGKIVDLWQKSPKEEIFILMSCLGGSVSVGFMFIDVITTLKINTTTIGSGHVGSMAIPIFAAGNKRYVTRHTLFFFHELSHISDKDELLRLTELRSEAHGIQTEQDWYVRFISERTEGKFPENKILKLIETGSHILPSDAVHYGLAHKII